MLLKKYLRISLSVFVLLFALFLLPGFFQVHAQTTPEVIDTATYNGHAYYLLSSDNWTNSEAFAQTLGGHLATINDEAENAFVYNTFTNNGTELRGLWLGLNDVVVEGTFVWASGEPVTFTKFASGEPNNNEGNEDYVHIFYPLDFRAPYWNDAPDSSAPFSTPFFGVVEVVPSCTEWNMVADFRVSPNQANPNPDNCGNSNVWYFLEGYAPHNPGTYTLLPEFLTDSHEVEGLQGWQNATNSVIFPNTKLPYIVKNTTGALQHIISFDWPIGAINVHPWFDKFPVVGWRSSVSGLVNISARFSDLDSAGGDGVDWFIDQGVTNLAQGSLNGNAQDFQLSSLSVNAGDYIYFAVTPRGDPGYDSTCLDININSSGAAGSYVSTCPPPPPSPTPTPTVTPTILQTATYNGHTYHLLSSDNWTNSEAFAQTLGGHLVTINDLDENSFVYNTFTNNGTINRVLWTGLKRAAPGASRFVWANGETMCGANFASYQPDNNLGVEGFVFIYDPSVPHASLWGDAPDLAAPYSSPFYGVVEIGSSSPNPISILESANYNGHTYYLLTQCSWTDSEAFAQTLGGHLATINDEAENAFIYDTFTHSGAVNRALWIGLNDVAVEGTFVWASGEPVTFTKFGTGEPISQLGHEDYVHIFYPLDFRAQFWNDAPDYPAFYSSVGAVVFGVVEVVPSNNPPTVITSGPYHVDEGGSVQVAATGNDPENGLLTYAWDFDNNDSFETPGQSVTFSAANLDGPDTRTIAVQVTDDGGLTATDRATINVNNLAPVVGTITAPTSPQEVNTVVNASASFTDDGIPDTHTAEWNWGDNTTSTGDVDQLNNTVTGNHAYTTPGVYEINLTVTDDDGESDQPDTPFQYLVVYNPAGGFVTGAGRYDAPAGSIPSEPTRSGMTIFGTNAKYVNNVLTGSTRLNFRDGPYVFSFDSSSYDWLVVTDGTLADLHGGGSVNGVGGYTFELTAQDDSPDTIRIQIWDLTNTLVYDNNTSPLTNGNIEVHN